MTFLVSYVTVFCPLAMSSKMKTDRAVLDGIPYVCIYVDPIDG